MSVYFVQDPQRKENQTAQTGFYSALYIEEMCSRLGVTATALPIQQLADTQLVKGDALFIGDETLTPSQEQVLSQAAKAGTLVVGFATKKGGSLFGCTQQGVTRQTDPYETVGYFAAQSDLLPTKEKNVTLPVMADLLQVKATNAVVVGTVAVQEKEVPGLLQNGNAYYFTFDVPGTLCKIVQGKPVSGPSNYFPVGRRTDGRSLPVEYDNTIAAADMYLLLLEKLLWQRGLPMVHQLPAMEDGTPADLLFYFGGDDDATSGELDLKASQIMADRGLPYHMNVMPKSVKGEYALSKEQYDDIIARGHELALHYDMTGSFALFSKEAFENQIGTFVEAFGDLPVSNVAHCLVQEGYTEYARYQAELGIKGDNGHMGILNEADINAFNIYGFGFGSAYPSFIYDDAQHKGKRLDFCSIPISYYEPRIGGQYGDSDEKLRECAEAAVYYGRSINLFTHPHYVAFYQGYDSNMTLNAFDTILNICKENGWQTYLAGVDKFCLWWHERSGCRLQQKSENEWTVSLAGDSAMVMKIPMPSVTSKILIDGQEVPTVRKTIGGLDFALVTVTGKGEHTLLLS